MKFAVPFNRQFKYFDDNNIELNIKYKPKIILLNTFISEYNSYRINLSIEDFDADRDIEIIKTLQEAHPDCKLVARLPHYTKELEQILVNQGLPHFYNEYVDTWEKFNEFLSLSVTDIIIAGDLAFDLKFASLRAKENGVSLRVFCNIVNSSFYNSSKPIQNFFIRPEDVRFYSQYIDTFDFFFYDNSAVRINTYYEIYAQKQKWSGKLSELIYNYHGDEDNRCILPIFAEHRAACGRRCLREGTGSCNICGEISELSKVLIDNDIVIKIEK